jgi:hypothetical protein
VYISKALVTCTISIVVATNREFRSLIGGGYFTEELVPSTLVSIKKVPEKSSGMNTNSNGTELSCLRTDTVLPFICGNKSCDPYLCTSSCKKA